ncbi:MAG TPA: hypothetical protein VGE44_09195 [Daejeonella sp.]|uniref:hypothetical protein n=1 Tax=Daejeonella sp. TaxID=2805397 RepID=UPI002ED7C924
MFQTIEIVLFFTQKNEEMIDGINFITDESGNNKAIILDLVRFKKDGVKDKTVLEALVNLQQLIDNAVVEQKSANTWDQAKEKLKNFNP